MNSYDEALLEANAAREKLQRIRITDDKGKALKIAERKYHESLERLHTEARIEAIRATHTD
jgi:hypothetical protein